MAAMTPGWASAHLEPIRSPPSAPDPADVLAMQLTLARYAFALDQHDLMSHQAVHTAGARWSLRFADATEVGPIIGRDAIIEFVRTSQASESAQHRHHLSNVTVHSATPDGGRVHAYLLVTSTGRDGSPTVLGTGFHRFHLSKHQNEWLINDLFLGTDNAW